MSAIRVGSNDKAHDRTTIANIFESLGPDGRDDVIEYARRKVPVYIDFIMDDVMHSDGAIYQNFNAPLVGVMTGDAYIRAYKARHARNRSVAGYRHCDES